MGMVVIRVAREFDVMKFTVTKIGKARTERCVRERRCCACEEKFNDTTVVEHCCGNCKTCYNAARRAIREGRWSIVTLVRSGEMLPPQSGRKPANKFTKRAGRRATA